MTGLLARLLLASGSIDWLFRKFEAARLELVLAFASDRFLERYNDLVYARGREYHPGDRRYRSELFEWEEAVLLRLFPEPPARILIGAAGGGREAFALARRGYAVVAFEPSALARRMAAARPHDHDVGIFQARYKDLPMVRTLDGGSANLERLKPFDAGIIGWASFSHLPTDDDRVAALAAMTELVDGPVLVSYFGASAGPVPAERPTGLRRLRQARAGPRRSGHTFTIELGGFRQLTELEMRELADRAGVDVMLARSGAGWPHAVVRRRALSTSAGPPESTSRPASIT